MKMYILDNGSLDGSWKILYTDRADAPADRMEIPCSMFLIETEQGKLLFDGGVYPGGIRAASVSFRYQSRQQTLIEQLALCNTTVDEIKTVIISHMHYDHAGNLFLFPHAEVIAARREYEYAWQNVTYPDAQPHDAAYCRDDFDVPVAKWTLLDDDREIVPGVEAIMLPGHTPGMLGLVVHLDTQTFILPQDCLYTARNYGPPAVRSGLVWSEPEFYDSVEKVRRLQQRYKATIIFGHDMQQCRTLRRAPEFYR